MLKSITLANFKSYREATLHLGPLTFLIGANASGKSNALEAIRLLNWLAEGKRLDDIEEVVLDADTAFRGRGNDLFLDKANSLTVGSLFSDQAGEAYNFSLSIGLHNDQIVEIEERITDAQTKSIEYHINWENHYSNDDHLIIKTQNPTTDPPELNIILSPNQAIFLQLDLHFFHHRSHKLLAIAHHLCQALSNIVFLDPRPASMRNYIPSSKGDRLKEDGSNLSAVLFRICQQGEQAKAQLLQFIRSLPEQDITDIQFIETERKDVMVRLEESFGDQKRIVDAPLLSDGTLRVLAVAAALLSAPTGALVIIEEIDNGVHPSRADLLVNQLQAVAKERGLRVLVTSHNPALLDALPDEALGDVMCCYRDPKEGDSRLVRLGDFDRFPELLAQGPLGQLMTRRVLDRFLKDDRTPEQRRQANLEWLKRFKKSHEDEA